jgi:tetratricopeptide (TPR) repeat protein
VCSGDGIEEDDVLDLLGGLVDKSLVVAGAEVDGAVRYRMLEPIRQYALDKLEGSEEGEQVHSRHADYFLEIAEAGDLGLQGPDQKGWIHRLGRDHDNARAALARALERGDAGLGLQLAGSLGRFWQAQGHYSEGRARLEELLAMDNSGVSASVRAKALEALARLAEEQDDFDRVREATQEGLELCSEAGIEGSLAASLKVRLGDVAAVRGEYARAEEFYEESIRLNRETGDIRAIASGYIDLGNISVNRGDYERAKALYQQGLAMSRELGGADPLGGFLINLGYVSLLEGDAEQAMVLNEEAVALFRD